MAKITATITYLQKKRYYKDVGLPYSSVDLSEVFIDGQREKYGMYLPYGQSLHKLEISRGDTISFIAEVEEKEVGDGIKTKKFKRPRKFQKVIYT